jgi:NAD+ diphosphatase
VKAGHERQCTNAECKAQHFPRTDPAVIMLVTHGDQALLGRGKHFPAGMHSTLAGFVEPGESLEDAVAREVFEEVAVRVRDVRYHSSQPWPFPASIMLGYRAETDSTEYEVNPDELESARWFTRAELKEAQASRGTTGFFLPRKDSIARRLIEDWLDQD